MNHKENPFFNIAFNIIVPIIILNKGHYIFGSNSGVFVLLLALAFPVCYGLFDFIKNKKKNIISIFGTINVLFTIGFTLYKLSGTWFAIKEAAFPLLIGIFIFISAYTKKNFFKYIICNSPFFKWNLIEEKLKIYDTKNYLHKIFKQSTVLFSISFFISAILNFILALYVFSDNGAVNLSIAETEIILNQKVAQMTWLGFLVIGLPMTLFSGGICWWFIKKLTKLTHLTFEEMLNTPPR